MGDWKIGRGEAKAACGDAGFRTQMGEALFIRHNRTSDSHYRVGDHHCFDKTVKRCCTRLASRRSGNCYSLRSADDQIFVFFVLPVFDLLSATLLPRIPALRLYWVGG